MSQTKPTVKLLHNTPIEIADQAIGQCWGKGCFTGDKLKERMDRVANKFKHASTIEHVSYNFHISDVSRALLQELARHRVSSFSVKSTRYTLKELKDEKPLIIYEHGIVFKEDELTEANYYVTQAKKYLVFTGDEDVDLSSVIALENLRKLLNKNISNDFAKFALPESYKTELVWTINARSLQNFLKLRTDKSALWEIRNLAFEIFEQLPEEHKFLFESLLYKEKDKNVDS